MKLSLSVRVAESFSDKRKTTMTIDELIAMAKKFGYDAICMRASQAGTHSPPERIAEVRQKADAAGLPISMVTGDFAVPSNNDEGPLLLRNITPYLDLAESFGSTLIRVCMKKDEDIPFAQKSADEARERGIRLAHQSHCASLFETVDGSLRVLEQVDRPNFGIIYEPANWLVSGEDYGRQTIARLKPYLFNAYIQNHRLNPDGTAKIATWKKGPVPLDHIGVWESGGVDVEEMFAGFSEVGYQGYLTVHQAFGDVMPVEEAVRRSYEYLKPFTERVAV
jgi:sugar phosphate isomerase/epimerase